LKFPLELLSSQVNDWTFSAMMHALACCAAVLAVKVKLVVTWKKPRECRIVLEDRKGSTDSGGYRLQWV